MLHRGRCQSDLQCCTVECVKSDLQCCTMEGVRVICNVAPWRVLDLFMSLGH